MSQLLLAGKGPRQILDVLQIGAAQVLLETQDTLNFSISQHCYEYCNTLGWFYDTFEHPQRLKLLYVAPPHSSTATPGISGSTGERREAEVRAAGRRRARWRRRNCWSASSPRSQRSMDRRRSRGRGPIWRAAPTASRSSSSWRSSPAASATIPHNQELAQCLLEDYAKNRGFDRDRLLLACVQHTAVHRKYGDFLEAGRRFGSAMGIAELQ